MPGNPGFLFCGVTDILHRAWDVFPGGSNAIKLAGGSCTASENPDEPGEISFNAS
jgi:hypothetical protein